MKIYDISWLISEQMTSYKDKLEKKPSLEKKQNGEYNLKLDSHTGTHIDAPRHFIKNKKTIDKINLDFLIGKCKVIDFTKINCKITDKNLKDKNIKKGDIILLKTKNSFLKETEKFCYDFVYLDKNGAEFLCKKKIKCVGIDYLGIENKQPNHETHKILLKNNILIIEGLRLQKIKQGTYYMFGLPLKIKNSDASPARVILIQR